MYQQAIHQYLQQHGFGEFCPKAVLFDMDGVLYNSMPNHAYSWHTSMEEYGLVMPPEDAYLYEGMRGVETIKLLCEKQWGRIISDEEGAVEDYLAFLKLGNSMAPADLLATAKVDPLDAETYQRALDFFGNLVDAYELEVDAKLSKD